MQKSKGKQAVNAKQTMMESQAFKEEKRKYTDREDRERETETARDK